MRIVRVSASDHPTYGILEDAGSRIIGLTGDPLFQQVEHSGAFFTLGEERLLAGVAALEDARPRCARLGRTDRCPARRYRAEHGDRRP
ncbi:DUF2437 domain-containing protein [Nanchangia anserum]|uniref:DUF2437 domain-containing protein n=1 Tax=Nanchangia anserum TaxID=2692125 RepID=UPI0018847CC0|nr:DUF2437 domain-containing protein [Nanchangia anserum]QOX81170.1 DUF2437 domain-containing protein [Nanchangia anserum]